MKIVKLSAENIKRLVAVEITPDGNLVKITGKNGSGKTSVLDSIYWALAGERVIQNEPIREGQPSAKVTLDLGQYVVTRKFTGERSALHVTTKEGYKIPSPQGLLNELVGKISFDPLEFVRKKNTEQLQTIRDITGLDTADLDAEEERVREEQRLTNKHRQSLAARLDDLPRHDDAPQFDESITEAFERLDAAHRHNEEVRDAVHRIKNLTGANKSMEASIAANVAIINALKKRDLVTKNTDEMVRKVKLTEIQNQKYRDNQHHDEIGRELADAQEHGRALAVRRQGIADEKRAATAAVTMPIEGLSVEGDSLLYNGVPIEQASSAEQLRIGLAVAMALNPTLRVIRITDGSLLDSASLAAIESVASERDYQIWIEMVDESGAVGVVIEDGTVAA